MLHLVRDDAEYPFESEEELLVLIPELTNTVHGIKGFVDEHKNLPQIEGSEGGEIGQF